MGAGIECFTATIKFCSAVHVCLSLRSKITADSDTQLAIKMFLLSFDVALSLILISNSLLRYESARVHSILIGFSFQHHCSLETVYVGNIGRIM